MGYKYGHALVKIASRAAALSPVKTIEDMCVDDPAAKGHRCTDNCPVCYIMTPDNSLQLLSGASIDLGILDLVIETAQIGCRMCLLLCAVWQVNQEVCRKNTSSLAGIDWVHRSSNLEPRLALEDKKMHRLAYFGLYGLRLVNLSLLTGCRRVLGATTTRNSGPGLCLLAFIQKV